MKHLLLSLALISAPSLALAWAPYEQQSFSQQMVDTQVQVHAQPVVYEGQDPAMVPLAYAEDGYENESPVSTEGPLDAD